MAIEFRLDKFLKLREAERDSKKIIFLSAQNLVHESQNQLQTCMENLTRNHEETRQIRSSPILDANELKQRNFFHSRLSTHFEEVQNKLLTNQANADLKQSELNEAVKNVKVLQTLKEKNNERYLEETRHRSDRNTDELTSQQKFLEHQKTNH